MFEESVCYPSLHSLFDVLYYFAPNLPRCLSLALPFSLPLPLLGVCADHTFAIWVTLPICLSVFASLTAPVLPVMAQGH